MRVVLAHDVADDAGALVVAAVGAVAAVVHRVDHAAVHGLHAVAHIRQGSFDDDGQRVRQIGFAHLLLQIHMLDAFAGHQAIVGVVGLLGAQRLERAVGHALLVAGGAIGVVRAVEFVAVVVICHGVIPLVCTGRGAVGEAARGRFPVLCGTASRPTALPGGVREVGSAGLPAVFRRPRSLVLDRLRWLACVIGAQASMKRASCALRWMNRRRGSTSSPMSIEKVSSAWAASSMWIFFRMRCSGSMVVSHSSW